MQIQVYGKPVTKTIETFTQIEKPFFIISITAKFYLRSFGIVVFVHP